MEEGLEGARNPAPDLEEAEEELLVDGVSAAEGSEEQRVVAAEFVREENEDETEDLSLKTLALDFVVVCS